jgi:hypothetical protein
MFFNCVESFNFLLSEISIMMLNTVFLFMIFYPLFNFNQSQVGFANPSYPQNYPQKLLGKHCCPAPEVVGI